LETRGIITSLSTYLSNSNSTSDLEKESDDEFFDVEMEAEWSKGGGMVSSPSMSAPVAEEDPSDIEEDEDYDEEDDTSGEASPATYVG
jgi:hypothetical protein